MRESATIVTSRPGRTVWARPSGIASGGSSTGSRRKYSDLFSTNTTGFGSAIALSSSPAASAAPLGMTTFRPGTWVSHASRLWECCAPLR
jgi:hypothetical protein